MITAAHLINHEILTDHFGVSKVFETARRLRELRLYPSGKDYVNKDQAATMLYACSSCERISDVYPKVCNLENIKNRYSKDFISDFSSILGIEEALLNVKSIMFSQKTSVVVIEYTDKVVSYTDNIWKADNDRLVKIYTHLTSEYLIEFAKSIQSININKLQNI